MKGKILFPLLLVVLLAHGARAQYWQSLREGLGGTIGSVNVVYGDTVWDRLLVGCKYKWLIQDGDTLFIAGVAQWDGSRWDTLPARIQHVGPGGSNLCDPIWAFMRYEGDLYANGAFAFVTPNGEVNEDFARWNADSLRWEALECANPFNGGITGLLMVPPQDTMYLTGYRDSLCGYPESCAFAYNGSTIIPFAPLNAWPGTQGDYVGYVFRYQGQLYMTGLLNNMITGDFHGFLRFNGSSWEPVPGFTTPAPIKDVLIHDGKLYVCGYFFTDTGAPGNMITVFDGQQWSDMGGGLRYALPNSTSGNAYDLHEWNGDIYVAGQFNYAGGVYAENVARWNGHQWCGMGGHYATQTPGATVLGITHWRDTLYISGGFITIDGDTLNRVAKWLGEVENCSPSVGIGEIHGYTATLIPVRLNDSGLWELPLPENAQELRLYDARGRLMRAERLRGQRTLLIDLSAEPSGVYAVVCVTTDGVAVGARLFRP